MTGFQIKKVERFVLKYWFYHHRWTMPGVAAWLVDEAVHNLILDIRILDSFDHFQNHFPAFNVEWFLEQFLFERGYFGDFDLFYPEFYV